MQPFNRTAMRRAFAATLLLAGSAHMAAAQDLKMTLPKDPDVVTGQFANGLTYYVRHNAKPANKVELRLAVKTGAIMENENQRGLAHFMEHMNFNGLQHFQKNELVSYLQSIGVEFGADLNAYTGFDQTVFILPIPTDNPANLEKGFQIIEDWAHNANLTDQDINEERGVVLEESRLGKGADDRMLKKYFPKYASGTKYADRLPIGLDDILKTFKPETIRSFYKDWYRPNLQAVEVVGDIDTGTAMKMVRKHFEGLQNPKNERTRDYLTVQPRSKPDASVVTDKEASDIGLSVMFPHQKKAQEVTLGDYRDQIKRGLALQMMNQRFADLSKSANPPFPYAFVNYDGLIHGYEAFSASTSFGPEGPKNSLNAMMAELLRAKQYGFTQDELDRAKSDVLNAVEKSYNERSTTNSKDYIEEYLRNFLESEPFPGIANEYNYNKELMPTIKLEDVNELPKQWIANTNTFTLITAPEKAAATLPTEGALITMTQDAFKQEVKPMEEKAVAKSLMTEMPTAGKVVSQKEEKDLGATTYTLSNGIKVTLRPTDFKSDEIVMSGVRKGGLSNYGAEDQLNASHAGEMVDNMGIAGFTPTDLEKVLSGKTIKVDPSIGQLTDEFSGNCSKKDFETMLQLVHLYMTAPRADKDLFDASIKTTKQQLAFMSANPQVAYIDTTIKVLYHNSPLRPRQIPTPADYDQLNMEKSLAIFRNEFGSADGFNFYFVGNVDAATAIPLLETYLGSIPAMKKEPNFKDNGLRAITGKNTLKVHKGKEKKSLILGMYYGEGQYSEDMDLKTQAVAEVMNIKVIEIIREKMAAMYSGGYQGSFEQFPYGHYRLICQMPCGPENVDKVITANNEIIADLKAKGPDAKDLEKVKTQWHEKHVGNMKENSYWNGKLQQILFWGKDRNHMLNYDAWMNSLTPADVQKAANTLFNGKNEYTSILYPEIQG